MMALIFNLCMLFDDLGIVGHRKKCSKVNACNSKDIRRRNMQQKGQERIYSQVSFTV